MERWSCAKRSRLALIVAPFFGSFLGEQKGTKSAIAARITRRLVAPNVTGTTRV
jgi:hypothetical protein